MSHFSLVVVGSDIKTQMEAFNESSQEPQYREFKSTESKNMADYLTETLTIVNLPDGKQTHEYDDNYRFYDEKTSSSDFIFPEGFTKEKKKFCEFYSSFEEYMQKWCGFMERDETMGEFGYWTNPNGKWDWFEVGGRWSGYFKLKANALGQLGTPGIFKNEARAGWADAVKIIDIDFEFMKMDARKTANNEYDELDAILKGRKLPSWIEVLNQCAQDVHKARIIYELDPVVQDMNAAKFHVFGDLVKTFKNSRQEYVEHCAERAGVPFAVLINGQWLEKGQMGGWGIAHNEKEQDIWNREYWKFINALDPSTVLTLVDCHS